MREIRITDSGGEVHIFKELSPTLEQNLVIDNQDGVVEITSRQFGEEEKYISQTITTFLRPRKIEVVYGPYEES